MSHPEENDEDLFADLYENDDVPAKVAQPAEPASVPAPVPSEPIKMEETAAYHEPDFQPSSNGANGAAVSGGAEDMAVDGSGWNGGGNNYDGHGGDLDDNYGPINVKEDGKMFIGGLNWETTEQSLKDYFSQFGEVSECTVMRDSSTGRSRGFGFLTFKDPKCVNIVMVKEHYLDGKIIDPKRAIPREEQERTSKIFVGGVSQEATEEDFRKFFQQFGRVVDATLMMDKDTGRPRGFGFVTFDGDAAVDATLAQPLAILNKPIEVKRAQPRGNMKDGEDDRKFGRRGQEGKFGSRNEGQGNFDNQGGQNQQNPQGGNMNGMSPAMMAQYWQRMQQYFQVMQQTLAQNQQQAMNPMAAMGNQMNPAMMNQMMAANGMNRPQGMSPTGSPHPQSPQNMGQMGQMNPAMMQQMQQMQQMQMQQQGGFGGNPAMMNAGSPRPGYNAHEQLAFEQQKYEQQQARRIQQAAGYGGQGGPTSWEGMYDDIPQPAMPPSGPGSNKGNFRGAGGQRAPRSGSAQPPAGPSNAPANAPTGPKNAGKPGANYRGGGRNPHNQRFNPYGRNS